MCVYVRAHARVHVLCVCVHVRVRAYGLRVRECECACWRTWVFVFHPVLHKPHHPSHSCSNAVVTVITADLKKKNPLRWQSMETTQW